MNALLNSLNSFPEHSSPDRRAAFFSPGHLQVKICGVTHPDDAVAAVEAGADAIGINFYPLSRRGVHFDDVHSWIQELPVTRVAVVVNPSWELLTVLVESVCFEAIQFHGDESVEFCMQFAQRFEDQKWIRALRVAPGMLKRQGGSLQYPTPWLLLDTLSRQGYGGTGECLPNSEWAAIAEFVENQAQVDLAFPRRVVLAGGLTPSSVAKVVEQIRPYGVDVASGVEMSQDPRRKDRYKMQDFVAAARGV